MYESIIPGNYFLTKSMDWMRQNKTIAGEEVHLENYWFVKKFLVYYDYIFSRNMNIETRTMYKEIADNFSAFIDSLPVEYKESAKKYFFEIDIRNKNNFLNWNDFYDIHEQPEDIDKVYAYKSLAKKIYFVYLMQIGGQTGKKEEVLYTDVPNHVPYHRLLNKYEKSLLNDVTAALRNMRQLFYYYGFLFKFKEKSIEEYSLTLLGQAISDANWAELSLIMEHQKIRVISQPPTITIKNVENIDSTAFSIDLNPYLKILEYIRDNNSINREQFQYVVSRNTPINSDINNLKAHISKFKRSRDKANEDFSKELKKYLYGLWDSPHQKLNFIKSPPKNKTIFECINKDLLNSYINFLHGYANYKVHTLDKKSYENLLKQNYSTTKINTSISDLYPWLSYISTLDQSLIKSLLVYFTDSSKKFSEIKKDYPFIFKYLDINSTSWKQCVKILSECNDISSLYRSISDEFINYHSQEAYISSNNVALKNIEQLISYSNKKYNRQEAKHRTHISYIKNYYENMSVSTCDCCGEKSFITRNNKRYFEYHHLIPISENGPDHVLNIFGICANCHRKFHFQNHKDKVTTYQKLDANNFLKKENFQFASILNRMEQLYIHDQVDLLALNYLVKEQFLTNEQITKIILAKV